MEKGGVHNEAIDITAMTDEGGSINVASIDVGVLATAASRPGPLAARPTEDEVEDQPTSIPNRRGSHFRRSSFSLILRGSSANHTTADDPGNTERRLSCVGRHSIIGRLFSRRASAAGENVLVEGWEAVQDEQGRTYYWHQASDETRWERPIAPHNLKQSLSLTDLTHRIKQSATIDPDIQARAVALHKEQLRRKRVAAT